RQGLSALRIRNGPHSTRGHGDVGPPARPSPWGMVTSRWSPPSPGSPDRPSGVGSPRSGPAISAKMSPPPGTCGSVAPEAAVIRSPRPIPPLRDLRRLVDPAARGDPMSPVLWTCNRTRNLAEALTERGHAINHQTVDRLLTEPGYCLQSHCKTE